jgi:hypothetical protein
MPIESNRAMRIKNLTNLASILGQDLKEGCNASHQLFLASLAVNYKQLCFRQAFLYAIFFFLSSCPPHSQSAFDLICILLHSPFSFQDIRAAVGGAVAVINRGNLRVLIILY